MDITTTFQNTEIQEAFYAYPDAIRNKLLALRQMIFDVASDTDEVGQIEETLKWGQPSYLTVNPKSGTTIRIDQVSPQENRYAMFVHCQTTLIDTFRDIYPDELTYDGTRAIIFNGDEELEVDVVKHCIQLALTYHRDKKKGR
ncbi:MAG: DUF1801 domain-containing protein [Aggregatilineales bacterium]